MSGYPRPFAVSGAQMTRPADTTAYASGDLVANSTTAGSVVPFTFSGVARNLGYRTRVLAGLLFTDLATITNGRFFLHLFTALPTVTNGDNAAIDVATNLASYLGYLDITLGLSGTGQGGVGRGSPQSQTPGGHIGFISSTSQNLYGLLEVRGAYTPASGQKFTPTISGDQY